MLSAAQRDALCVSLLWTSRHTAPAVAKQLRKARSPGVPLENYTMFSLFFFFSHLVFWLVGEWHNKIWMRNMVGAAALHGCEVQVVWWRQISLLTVVPSWDAEGQMVCSQQVITASMLIHWHQHKWVTRTTQSIWDAVIVPSRASLWGFFYWVWRWCCAVQVVRNEQRLSVDFLPPFFFCEEPHSHKSLFSILHWTPWFQRCNFKGSFTEVCVCKVNIIKFLLESNFQRRSAPGARSHINTLFRCRGTLL